MSPQRQAPEEKIVPYILRRKLGEGTFTIPERTRPVASVYDNPEEDSP